MLRLSALLCLVLLAACGGRTDEEVQRAVAPPARSVAAPRGEVHSPQQ